MDQIPLSKSKKKARIEGGTIVFDDEATFRQTPTLVRTWAPLNSQPEIRTEGQRNSRKVYGAIGSNGKFVHKVSTENFNQETYVSFLETRVMKHFYRRNHRVFLVQDNASYHKAEETYLWFKENRARIEVTNLPPYFPELNAAERLWQYTRKNATHNRYFSTPEELEASIRITFQDIGRHPEKITNLIAPFF